MLSRITSILHRTCAKPTVSKLFAKTCTTTVFSTARSSRKYVFSAVLGGGLFLAVSTREDRAVGFESLEDMAPLDLPGRPHNLTETEKAKLKEMWATAFRVFGVPLSAGDAGDEVDQPNGVSRTPTIASETKEKKGGKLSSMFKKKKDKESTATLSDGTPDISKLAIGDGEDKYSQTKEFKEALATSSPKEIHDTFWKMVKADHPDSLFLRFLRARKWDVSKAIVMLVATMHWRSKEMDVLAHSSHHLMVGRKVSQERGAIFLGT
jgi:CRAL/TRIO, N-terminal domain